MRKLTKLGVAVVMGLVLTLSLLTAGVSAQSVRADHSSVTHTVVATTAAQTSLSWRGHQFYYHRSWGGGRWGWGGGRWGGGWGGGRWGGGWGGGWWGGGWGGCDCFC